MPLAACRRPARPVGATFVALCTVLVALCTASPTAQAQQTYRLTRLGSQYALPAGTRPLNHLGQVIFTDRASAEDPGQGAFHDGTTTYRIGVLAGGTRSQASAVNDAGQVVGQADTGVIHVPSGTRLTHAVMWSRTTGLVDLGSMGADTASAIAINPAGQVAGNTRSVSALGRGFFWSSTTGMIDMTPPGSIGSTVADLNASGQVIGTHTRADGSEGSFLWTRATGWTDLPLMPNLINDAGQVAGMVTGQWQAGFWSPGSGVINLGAGVWSQSSVNGLGPEGQVVGVYRQPPDDTLRSFSWTAGTGRTEITATGLSSVQVALGQSVNRSGMVVGSGTQQDGSSMVFSWQASTGLLDLSPRVTDLPAGLQIVQPFAIADNGNILVNTTEGLALLSVHPAATVPPVLGAIEATDPVVAGQTLNLSAAFTDADKADTHTATWSWGDGSRPAAGTVSESGGRGTASASHAFAAPGTYTVTLTLTDSGGRSARSSRDISVYDPGRGHIVGAGSFMSPPGTFKADPKAAGQAVFALVTRYQPGEVDPPGRMVFTLRGTPLAFRGQPQGSVTLNGTRASWSGTGRMNGVDGYRFAVTALDAGTPGTLGRGRLHLRIWHADRQGTPVLDYDNLGDPATLGTLREGTVPSTGRILVRSRATP